MVFLLVITLLSTCKTKKKQETILDRICGIWKIEGENAYEQWHKSNNRYISRMFSMNREDTIFSEAANLFLKDELWNFETIVKNQNNEKPVLFIQTELKADAITFANPEHDFPKFIHYELISDTVLHAYISGNSDTVRFNFARLQ